MNLTTEQLKKVIVACLISKAELNQNNDEIVLTTNFPKKNYRRIESYIKNKKLEGFCYVDKKNSTLIIKNSSQLLSIYTNRNKVIQEIKENIIAIAILLFGYRQQQSIVIPTNLINSEQYSSRILTVLATKVKLHNNCYKFYEPVFVVTTIIDTLYVEDAISLYHFLLPNEKKKLQKGIKKCNEKN